MKKLRADRLLVEKGLSPSRQKAAALIMAGLVFSGGTKVSKPGQTISEDAEITVKGADHPYVGRGGMKLAHALETFSIDVAGKTCMDVGASTGGFTDCLLKRGASRVYAIDVGYGQIAWELAKDGRVVLIERTNIRHAGRDLIPDLIDVAVIDVSFISLELVLPAVHQFLSDGANIIALIKPQFEVGRELVGKGGIVKDPESHRLAVEKVRGAGERLSWKFLGLTESPILGAKGNREFLICFEKGS